MHVRQVVALEVVVDVHLPVAVGLVGDAAVEDVVGEIRGADARFDLRDEFLERRDGCQRDEDEAAPGHERGGVQADAGDIEIGRVAHFGGAAELAVEVVGPAVVAAAQRFCTASIAFGQWPGAVAADVVQRAQHAVLAMHQQQRHAGDLADDVIAHLGELRDMCEQLPATREHGLLFERECGGFDVERRRQRDGVVKCLRRERHGIGAEGHRRAAAWMSRLSWKSRCGGASIGLANV